MLWKIPVTWEMYGCIEIEADTLEKAMKIGADPDGELPLPTNGSYVDGSWQLSSTDPNEVALFQKQAQAVRKVTTEELKRLREEYPTGCRVELVRMGPDPYNKLKPGNQGTVQYVDDIGTVFVSWDCGSGLGVVYGEDRIQRLPGKEVEGAGTMTVHELEKGS